MRDHSHHIEFSRTQAVQAMLEATGYADPDRTPEVELVPLAQSFGRVLAQDAVAQADVPNCLTCCMDSIAVKWSSFEDLPEGQLPDTGTWVRGVDWEFANTGIAMPEGFDTAIVIEHVIVSDDQQHVQIDAAPSAQYAGTRPAGEKLQRGASVTATAGTVITPDVAANIGSGNMGKAPVARKPRVAFIPTGNELVAPGVPYSEGKAFAAHGKNYETNSLLVQGKVQAWGGDFIGFDIVPDEPELISAAIRQACAQADIVVLNAGSSKGSDDWSVEQMEELGTVYYHETNHGPGHHSSFAMVDGKPVVGISGPAGGASFTLDFYLRPLMRAFLGLSPEGNFVPARLTQEFPAKKHGGPKTAGDKRPSIVDPGKTFYGVKPVRVELGEDGVLTAIPVNGRPGSSEAADANGLYMLSNKADEQPHAGDVIQVELR
ncbi:MAG: molybdopterin-binding protein [Coriobacteriia bacterium]|nr:molybdopterin-binding protein [Coriobacteriia bacterium]